MNIKLLENELSKIENIGLRNIIENFIDEKVPDYIEKSVRIFIRKISPNI